MKRVYLDWNATAPPDPRVLDRMAPFLSRRFGNPSSLHQEGREARRAVEDARETFAAAIGAEPREIVFCSGATEANNLALEGFAASRAGAVVVSAIEHPSVLECAEALRGSGRAVLEIGAGADGRIDAAHIATSSGHAVLDDAALDMVRRAAPVPKPQDGAVRLLVPVVFALGA